MPRGHIFFSSSQISDGSSTTLKPSLGISSTQNSAVQSSSSKKHQTWMEITSFYFQSSHDTSILYLNFGYPTRPITKFFSSQSNDVASRHVNKTARRVPLVFLDEGHCTRFVPLHSDRKKNYNLFWITYPTKQLGALSKRYFQKIL